MAEADNLIGAQQRMVQEAKGPRTEGRTGLDGSCPVRMQKDKPHPLAEQKGRPAENERLFERNGSVYSAWIL